MPGLDEPEGGAAPVTQVVRPLPGRDRLETDRVLHFGDAGPADVEQQAGEAAVTMAWPSPIDMPRTGKARCEPGLAGFDRIRI